MDFQSLPAEPKQGNALLVSISIVVFLANSAYMIVSPLLPFAFKEKGVSEVWAGFIFS